MRIPEQYKCDATGCEAVHTPTNHWWVVMKNSVGVVFAYPWEVAEHDHGYTLQESKHFCGQAHALQYVSQIMGEGKGGQS